MLIQALCSYADQLAERAGGQKIPDGWSEQKVSFEVLLTPEGKIGGILDIRNVVETPQKKGKTKITYSPRTCLLPLRTQVTGICSNTIEHRPLYLFGLNLDQGELKPCDKTNKAKKSHDAFVAHNREFFQDLDSEICHAFYAFLQNWNPESETENPHLKKCGALYKNNYFCFGLQSDPNVRLENDPAFREKYDRIFREKQIAEKAAQKESDTSAQCAVLGEVLPVARIHDKIKLPGGNSTGCVMVGMKESAFWSYGKTQSYNSNISEKAMKKYTSALNYLAGDRRHHKIMDEMCLVYFAMKPDDAGECDLFSFLLGDPTARNEAELDDIFRQAVFGRAPDLSALHADADATFYVAGLSPNSSRICQKFLYWDKYGTFIANLVQHQKDLACNPARMRQVSFDDIRKQLVSPVATNPKVPSPLMASIMYAAFHGSAYPTDLLATVIRRVKTDSDNENNHFIKLNDVRTGIIKACLNRKARLAHQEEEITMSLNKENQNPAYLCGRLFAVYEMIQQSAADGNLNRTIKDAYFSSACGIPRRILPQLDKLSKNHLRKIGAGNKGREVYFEKLIGEIMDKLDGSFPATLSLEEQGCFIVGYQQQITDFYQKKAESKSAE